MASDQMRFVGDQYDWWINGHMYSLGLNLHKITEKGMSGIYSMESITILFLVPLGIISII